jgi:hypothetical protein
MHELRLNFGEQRRAASVAIANEQDTLLRDFLARYPAQSAEAIPAAWYDLPLREFHIVAVRLERAGAAATPDGGLRGNLDSIYVEEETGTLDTEDTADAAAPDSTPAPAAEPPPADAFPESLSDGEAVRRAYAAEIVKIGRYLSSDLSVLVVCDKVLVEHIYRHAVRHSNKRPTLEGDPGAADTDDRGSGGLLQREIAGVQTRIAKLGQMLAGIKPDQVLVLRHLDMLAGGTTEGPLTPEARLLTEMLYRSQEFTPTLLGFADPSTDLPKVLADRFSVRIELAGMSRDVLPRLMTRAEQERFASFDRETLFKNVSGFNAMQLRNAMRYLRTNSEPGTPTPRLMALLREFKRGSSDEVEIPTITFDQIGGYQQVKQELFEAIELITGRRPPFNPDGTPVPSDDREPPPESEEERAERRALAPRGFIFHGPPGTGKTLFAKAIANAMNATIQMVSGPEIMDMWVGKSESNLRRLFTLARRNAPAVIFFDEFDSIAAQRGGIDGGSRASNAVVAQLLTELDGFHADQDILVIGTTNRLDIIDEALLRPSRFQPIQIELPDQAARRAIAGIYAGPRPKGFAVPMEDPYILELVAEHTEGFNGDELRAIFQELARQVRQGQSITTESFGIQIGLIRKRRDERMITHVGPRARSGR